MNPYVTKASGKVMLFGEYSVLFGGPAIVKAVISPFATCTFACGDVLGFSAHSDNKKTDIFDPLWSSCIEACRAASINPPLGHYTVDTREFFLGHRKLGLGSSAAATVALIKMFVKLAGKEENPRQLLQLALLAHRDFSKGLGSGADIAASIFGHTISYQITETIPVIKQMVNPLFDEIIFIDTQKAQDTRVFVERVLHFKEICPGFIQAFCSESTSLVEKLCHEPSIDHSRLITIIDQSYRGLKELSDKASIDIISEPHQHIYEIAKSFGGSAKPSGAGGGDLAMALVPKTQRISFIEGIFGLGFRTLDIVD